jgi:asparagine synthase (glutamine-hydrolysing)
MCGIAGVVRFDRPGAASLADARAIRDRIAHRGPDGQGEVACSHAALAHARLAMVDAAGGAQPYCDDRYTLVYNGELYNHDALRARLADRQPGGWHGRSDTETVLAAWRAWGPACVDQLDGMYAFFIWDDAEHIGHAVRDRLGVKPFAYAELAGGGLAFASEAHALGAVLGTWRADREAIVEYLVAPMFSGVARSPLAGARYLAPGHVLSVSRDGIVTNRYWRWRPGEVARRAEPDELRDALADAVARACRSDVPLGVFLSGGLDSTAITAFAPDVDLAFAVTFEGAERWERDGTSRIVVSDDAPFARLAARALGKTLVEVPYDRAALAAELAAVAHVDDALPAWEQELAQRALARVASTRVKGVLVGDAADELHYGYHFLLDAQSPAEIVTRLGPVPIRREVERDPVARLGAEYAALATADDGPRPIGKVTRAIVERWLPRLLHDGDIQTMAFGLEARVPFAASRVIELAMWTAPQRAMAGGVEKAALREQLRGVVPEAIRTRRKSALPKEQDVAEVYRAEAKRVADAPHAIVRALVDLAALAPAIHGDGALDERARGQLFRVIALHHWAIAHGVVA